MEALKRLFRTRYRIVTDTYCGYEAQFRYWWMPFYAMIEVNSLPTVEAAKEYVEKSRKRVVCYGL